MANVTAALVNDLRKRTGAGIMECKKALLATDGDIDAAADELRKSGIAKADKRSARVAAEGVILLAISDDRKSASLLEVNCETDFVARDQQFQEFTKMLVANCDSDTLDVASLLAKKDASGKSLEESRCELVAKIGENIQLRRMASITSNNPLGVYQHGERIAACVSLSVDEADLAKDIAMHVAATKPEAIDESGLNADVLAKEREVYLTRAKESGKPEAILDKIVSGQVAKFIAEHTLLGQPFIKDTDQTVAALLSSKNAKVDAFIRLEVGEGIEKEEQDFAAEVQAQIKDSD